MITVFTLGLAGWAASCLAEGADPPEHATNNTGAANAMMIDRMLDFERTMTNSD
jgi:hypothetical protein